MEGGGGVLLVGAVSDEVLRSGKVGICGGDAVVEVGVDIKIL